MIGQAQIDTTIDAKCNLDVIFPEEIESYGFKYVVPVESEITIDLDANIALCGSFHWTVVDHYEVRIMDETTGTMFIENNPLPHPAADAHSLHTPCAKARAHTHAQSGRCTRVAERTSQKGLEE